MVDNSRGLSKESPIWKVYFEGSFWGHHNRDHAGQEIRIGREFSWGGRDWVIPACYACGKGLVIDLCMRVPADRIQSFLQKWRLTAENADPERFTREQQMQIDAENPLCVSIRSKAAVNGKPMKASHGCGVCWCPCLEYQNPEALKIVEHYGLDPADGWAIERHYLLWPDKRRPAIHSLDLALSQKPVETPGPHFRVHSSGDTVSFVHPMNNTAYTLTVREQEQQELSKGSFSFEQNQVFPSHYTVLRYTVTPDLPDHALMVCVCAENDPPRQKTQNPLEPKAHGAACVAVIGGADGPTALANVANQQDREYTACSALHFEPAGEVEWRLVFFETQADDISLTLL